MICFKSKFVALRLETNSYSMDITGKIIFASEPRSGTSKTTGNPWMTQDFVIETHEQYPKKCVFTVFGEDRLKQMNIQLNGEYTVSFDIDAHEFNGRWFNDIRAWRAVPAVAGVAGAAPAAAPTTSTQYAAPTQAAQPAPQATDDPLGAAPDNVDDLPF